MNIACYTIISHDHDLLRWCINNARERAGIGHRWMLINWINEGMDSNMAAERICRWCIANNVGYYPYKAVPQSQFPDRTKWFLHNLYACWNLGYEHAEKDEFVARLGSDQFFSQGWLGDLAIASKKSRGKGVYHCWSVESILAGGQRHPIISAGTNFRDFSVGEFEKYVAKWKKSIGSERVVEGSQCGLAFNHPKRGAQIRPDGLTWLQSRKLWEKFGPMRGDINEEGVTGDVDYMDRMTDAGVPQYSVRSCLSFHLVRGETRQEESTVSMKAIPVTGPHSIAQTEDQL